MKRTTLVLAAVLPLAVLLGLFWGREPGLPAGDPLLIGQITRITGAQVLIEEVPGEPAGSAKCVLTVTDGTAVLRETGGKLQRAAAAELQVGQRVKGWSSGPVRESYPCQATAAAIVILEG